jgi:PAS domain S-box-containing protein
VISCPTLSNNGGLAPVLDPLTDKLGGELSTRASKMKQKSIQPDDSPVVGPGLLIKQAENARRAKVDNLSSLNERLWDVSELKTLRKAVEASGEIIFLTDWEGVITYVNPEFTRLYGYSAQEVVGQTTPRILKSGRMTAGEYELFWEMLVNKQVVKGVFINICKDRKLVTIEGSANPVLDENGDIYGFLAIQRDITQRVEREEKSRQRNKELAVLYAITTTVSQSLDLNQILNTALEEVLQLDMFGGAAKGMLFRLDEEVGELLLISNRGAPKDHPCLTRPVQLGECLCGFAAQQRKVVISEDCFSDTRHGRHWPTMPKHKDICLPLQLHERVLGVMNVRLPATHEIVDHDVNLLTSVADQIGVDIENARVFGEKNDQHKKLLNLSTRLADAE